MGIWISVYEDVIGIKLRTLAKEIGCSQNEALGILIRLWIWGISNADASGRLVGADEDDIAEVLTVGLVGGINPEKVVDALFDTEWLDKDETDTYIHDWSEWQKQWYTLIDKREKDKERKRRTRRAEREQKPNRVEIPEEKKKDVPTDSTKSKPASNYSCEFENFWKVYPRKVGKGEAYKKYQTRVKEGWKEEELLAAALEYAKACERNKTESKYIKHAKTFLSDATPFVDYIPSGIKTEEPVKTETDDDNPYADWGMM